MRRICGSVCWFVFGMFFAFLLLTISSNEKNGKIQSAKPPETKNLNDAEEVINEMFRTGKVTKDNSFATMRSGGSDSEVKSDATREDLRAFLKQFHLSRVKPIAQVFVEVNSKQGTNEFVFKLLVSDGQWKISEIYFVR